MRWILALCLATAAFAQDIVPGRYILELTGDPAIVHKDRARRRVEIQTEQQSLERALRTRRATVRARVDTVANALIVDAPNATGLASLPGVRRVEPVRRFKPLLLPQLENHQVAAAWEAIGGIEKAGAGIKIGILDSGLNTDHLGFKPPEGMTAPKDFPQATPEEDLQFTNGKIIVARAFDGGTITDTTGHGTGVAMAAAGVQHDSPRGTISGVAPHAWLGIYRVTNSVDQYYYTDTILQALDWAVKDGMDVVNLSFGSPGTTGATGDLIFESGTRRATESGILVVHAAGNTPGAQTVDDAASAEKEIAVGANTSTASPSVFPSVGRPYPAAESDNVTTLAPVSGPVVDAETLNGNLLGCDPFPLESMTNQIAFIRRGDCTFATKLANAAAAGAIAAIVYNSPNPPSGGPDDLVYMQAGASTLPGLFIGNTNGGKLKELIHSLEDFTVQLRFPGGAPNSLAWFTSLGPAITDLAIKPDLVATGTSFYTAAVVGPANSCALCDPSGYTVTQGTSFSAPLVAGAAAVLKSARPGLTSDDYRSLLINAASSMILASGSTADVMAAGNGALNLKNALSSTIAAAPVSLSFAAGDGTVDRTKNLTLKNLAAEPATWTLSVDSANDTKPALSADTLTVGPGESAPVKLSFLAAGLAAGAFQGFVKVQDTTTGVTARIPYWYAVTGGVPASLSLIVDPYNPKNPPSAGQQITLIVRVHDAAGLPLPDVEPIVTPVPGSGGTVDNVKPSNSYPNCWRLTMHLGSPGLHQFRIQIGDVAYFYTITAI
ncbi:MAG TPA: S8 family serine peptidase [Paludibaculum sp.]